MHVRHPTGNFVGFESRRSVIKVYSSTGVCLRTLISILVYNTDDITHLHMKLKYDVRDTMGVSEVWTINCKKGRNKYVILDPDDLFELCADFVLNHLPGKDFIVEKKAKIRNRDYQVPCLTRNTIWENDKKYKKTKHTKEPRDQPFPSR